MNHSDPGSQRKLNEYRERFRTAPVGAWSTARGTFDAVSDARVEFAADHTGTVEHRSGFSGASLARFEWREKSEHVIEARYVEAADDENEEEEWDEIAYDFMFVESDTGAEVAMHEVGREAFWDCLAPLRLVE